MCHNTQFILWKIISMGEYFFSFSVRPVYWKMRPGSAGIPRDLGVRPPNQVVNKRCHFSRRTLCQDCWLEERQRQANHHQVYSNVIHSVCFITDTIINANFAPHTSFYIRFREEVRSQVRPMNSVSSYVTVLLQWLLRHTFERSIHFQSQFSHLVLFFLNRHRYGNLIPL